MRCSGKLATFFFSVFVVKEEKRREKQLCLTEISGSVDALDKLKQAVFFLLDFSVLLKLVAERERESYILVSLCDRVDVDFTTHRSLFTVKSTLYARKNG